MKSVLHQISLFKETPSNGLAIFTGLVTVDRTPRRFVRVFEPLVAVTQGVYYCDQRFHSETLRSDLSTQLHADAFGFVIVDGRHSVLGLVSGVERRILHEWKNISLPRKHSKGGQSSVRFENIRVEKRGHFIKKLCELANKVFIPNRTGASTGAGAPSDDPSSSTSSSCRPIVSHLIVAGVASLKNDFVDHDELDYRLARMVSRPLFDLPYGGRLGFDAAVAMSRDRIQHLGVIKQEQLVNKFITEVHTNSGFNMGSKVVFGVRRVLDCLVEKRCVKSILLMDDLDLNRVVYQFRSSVDGSVDSSLSVVKYVSTARITDVRVELERHWESRYQVEVLKSRHLGEWIAENMVEYGCQSVEFVSPVTAVARQFRNTFGGIGAFLWYVCSPDLLFEENGQQQAEMMPSFSDGDGTSSDEESEAQLWDFSQDEEEEGEEEMRRRNRPRRKKTTMRSRSSWRELRQERLGAVHSGKPSLTCIFVGHVDHGKSTIAGQLLVQSGSVEERLVTRYQHRAAELRRDSWYLAYLLDCSEDERERGKTVEVGRTFFETESKSFTILDSPGHENYVPFMLESASEADVAVLIVSAKRNEFEKGLRGQTKEHAMLIKAMGVTRLIVAVNKMDAVDWSQEAYEGIVQETRDILTQELLFRSEKLTFVPVSAINGDNIASAYEPISGESGWYGDGPCLMSALDGLRVPPRKSRSSKPLRLPVIDKIHECGNFLTVVGKVQQGVLRVGQEVSVSPEFTQGIVESIKIGCEVSPLAIAGDNVEVIVKGLTNDDISVGSVISGTSSGLRPKKHLLAEIAVVEPDCFLSSGASAMLHCHTTQARAVITVLRRVLADGQQMRVREGVTGQRLVVRLDLDRRVCVLPFEEASWCGRFVLRRETTIAVGRILKAN